MQKQKHKNSEDSNDRSLSPGRMKSLYLGKWQPGRLGLTKYHLSNDTHEQNSPIRKFEMRHRYSVCMKL